MEFEERGTLNYLDVSLTRRGNMIERNIYRKEVATTTVIPKKAMAPKQYKRAAFEFYLKRADIICSKENLGKELGIIKQIANEAGYSTEMVNKIWRNIKSKRGDKNKSKKKEEHKYVGSITYYKGLGEIIKNAFKKRKTTIALKTESKMFNILKNESEDKKHEDKSGVYIIPFKQENCTRSYVGMTGRRLKHRIKEHKRDIENGTEKSALARLNMKEDIEVDFKEARIIAPYTTKHGTLMRESIEITIKGKQACNEGTSLEIPIVWRDIINKMKRPIGNTDCITKQVIT